MFFIWFLPASFVPTIVIIDDKTSDKLFTASKITAIELDNIPIVALKAAKKILVMIPIALVLQ